MLQIYNINERKFIEVFENEIVLEKTQSVNLDMFTYIITQYLRMCFFVKGNYRSY